MTANNESHDPQPAGGKRLALTIELDSFASTALEDEARAMSVSIEEVASFALQYYLADRDSGRTARRLPHPAADGAKRSSRGLHAR
ncbi:MAG TPA: hypothetical protein VH081_09680 [Solirubrobacteraceae bacterium]|nr:hypothetical protein [Solirubrobacteraceae bacterium]